MRKLLAFVPGIAWARFNASSGRVVIDGASAGGAPETLLQWCRQRSRVQQVLLLAVSEMALSSSNPFAAGGGWACFVTSALLKGGLHRPHHRGAGA